LRGRHIALAATLDLIEDNTSDDDQENAAKRTAKGYQNNDSV
jgi:hypothetical protein